MRILIVFLVFLFYGGGLYAQNFEGIIIYERQTNKNKVAFEKYFFGKNKLRIDADFINGNVEKYSTIYDFSETQNLYFSAISCNRYDKNITDMIYLDTILYINTEEPQSVLDYSCEEIELKYKEGDFGTIQNQIRLVANDLIFSIPDGWIMEYGMVIAKDNRITLYLEEEISSVDFPDMPPKGYTRKAIAVIPMKLPESIFEVENR